MGVALFGELSLSEQQIEISRRDNAQKCSITSMSCEGLFGGQAIDWTAILGRLRLLGFRRCGPNRLPGRAVWATMVPALGPCVIAHADGS